MRILISLTTIALLQLLGLKAIGQEAVTSHVNFQELYYLDSGLLISGHSIEVLNGGKASGVADLSMPGNYRMHDSQPYYFQFDPASCNVDPFNPSEDSAFAKESLRNCLQVQIWENDNISYWMKATGAAVIIGLATGSGKEDLSISIGFDEVDSLLRQWLSGSAN